MFRTWSAISSTLFASVLCLCITGPLRAQDSANAKALGPLFTDPTGTTLSDLEALGRLREIHASMTIGVDTTRTSVELRRSSIELELLKVQSTASATSNNVRAIRDVRSEIDRIRQNAEVLLRPISTQLEEFELARKEIQALLKASVPVPDSIPGDLATLQRLEHARIDELARRTLGQCDTAMLALLTVQGRGIELIVEASLEHDRLTELVVRAEGDIFRKGSPPLWSAEAWDLPAFGHVFVRSFREVVDLVMDFVSRAWHSLIPFRVLLALILLIPFRYLLRSVRGKESTPYSDNMHMLLRYPMQVGTIAVLAIVPLLFQHVPSLILDLFFLGMLFPIAYIFVKENAFVNRLGFVAILLYYVLLKVSNVMLEMTTPKRVLLLLVVFLIPRAFVFLKGLMKSAFAHKGRARALIYLVTTQALIGWFGHLLGWSRLGNNLITVALEVFFLAIALHIAVTAVYEYLLLLADRHYRRSGSVVVNLLHAKVPIKKLLDLITVVFWGVSYLQAMDIYELVEGQVLYVLNATREFASVRFTWGSILLFVGVFALTLALSELLRKLFQDDEHQHTTPNKARGFVLLMRLGLLIAGFFLAMNLAGIPLDRMTVVIGALGVGIGFGLQNLTNNLVSGIMLALERPVRPGDVIDVKGNQGTVVEIGVRSTRVLSLTGSTLIVPNGMLISELVSNRTLTDRTGEVLMKVSVPANSDMDRVLRIISEIIVGSKLQGMPEPSVNLVEIGRAWAQIEVRIWVHDVLFARAHRTEVLAKISKAFRDHDIDLRTHSFDPTTVLPDEPS